MADLQNGQFYAQWGGVCAEGHALNPGDLVQFNADGHIEHVDCTPAADPFSIAAHESVCGTCWLVHSGECA